MSVEITLLAPDRQKKWTSKGPFFKSEDKSNDLSVSRYRLTIYPTIDPSRRCNARLQNHHSQPTSPGLLQLNARSILSASSCDNNKFYIID